MEREEGETGDEETNKNEEQEVNNMDVGGEVEACDRVVSVGDQEELEELEQSLQALERLDRSSPDLWPDQVGREKGNKIFLSMTIGHMEHHCRHQKLI